MIASSDGIDRERSREMERIQKGKPTDDGARRIEYDGDVDASVLEIYTKEENPSFERPVAKFLPSIMKEWTVIDAYGEEQKVFVSRDGYKTLFIPVNDGDGGIKFYKYVLLTKIDPPVIDLFYHVLHDHAVYYYVPAGNEYERVRKNEELKPSTHYLIDFENEKMYEHPLGNYRILKKVQDEVRKEYEHGGSVLNDVLSMVKPRGIDFKNVSVVF